MTGRILSVALDPGTGALSRRHRIVLASLPARFRVVAGPAADVLLVSGDQDGWQQRARRAVSSEVSAIMFSGTSAQTADAVAALCRDAALAGVLAAADPGYASARGWTDVLPALVGDLADCAVLDSIVTIPTPPPGTGAAAALRAALVQQLALLRSLLGEVSGFTAVHLGAREYVLATVVRELAVTLSGVISGGTEHGLDLALVGAQRRWHASFAAGALASPARISAWDAGGERARLPVYESGHRAAWLKLHSAVCQQSPLPYAADQLAADLAVAELALGLTQG